MPNDLTKKLLQIVTENAALKAQVRRLQSQVKFLKRQATDSTKNFLATAPAKNCTVKNAPGNPGTGEHIVQLSVPEVIAGEPVVWKLTWALPNDEYERFMQGAGKWLVTYQY